MSAEYTKVYSQFWNSSLADAPPFARLLFLALLSMADERGEITATMSAIARFANLPLSDVEQAMEILQAPDPDSTSPDHEGRRILRDGNHWLVVNYAKYYERGRNEDRKEYKRNWDREHKETRFNRKSDTVRHSPTEPDKSDLEKKRKEKRVNPPIVPPCEIETAVNEIWEAYPKRDGLRKREGRGAIEARLLIEKIPADELLAGTKRYADYITARGDPTFTMAAERFYDAENELWRDPWKVPPTEKTKNRKFVNEW